MRKARYQGLLSALLEADMIANEAFDAVLNSWSKWKSAAVLAVAGDRPRRNLLRA
jgi:hypothetical protein